MNSADALPLLFPAFARQLDDMLEQATVVIADGPPQLRRDLALILYFAAFLRQQTRTGDVIPMYRTARLLQFVHRHLAKSCQFKSTSNLRLMLEFLVDRAQLRNKLAPQLVDPERYFLDCSEIEFQQFKNWLAANKHPTSFLREAAPECHGEAYLRASSKALRCRYRKECGARISRREARLSLCQIRALYVALQGRIVLDLKRQFMGERPCYLLRISRDLPRRCCFEPVEPVSCDEMLVPGLVLTQMNISKFRQQVQFRAFNPELEPLNADDPRIFRLRLKTPFAGMAPIPKLPFTNFSLVRTGTAPAGAGYTTSRYAIKVASDAAVSCFVRSARIIVSKGSAFNPETGFASPAPFSFTVNFYRNLSSGVGLFVERTYNLDAFEPRLLQSEETSKRVICIQELPVQVTGSEDLAFDVEIDADHIPAVVFV